ILLVTDRETPLHAAVLGRTFSDDAWDVVHRDASLEEYDLRMERLRVQVDRLEELDELRYIAVHDERTDLLRPRAFQDRLREHFSAAQRHDFDLALLLCDLDEFGKINKAYDHTIGDLVIERVGGVIRGALRAEDIAGRLGGDEFAILLPYTEKKDAARAAARVRDRIGELQGLLAERGIQARISASLGFETYSGKDLESVDDLRRNAEAALRAAKEQGGDQGVYYRTLVPRPS
ncbi:MAG: GGDEF domain-containing protein, partial [Planctomycetota bacterium]